MLSVCSAVPSCSSSSSLISSHFSTRSISLVQKSFLEGKRLLGNRDSVHHYESSFKTHAGREFHLPTFESLDQTGSIDSSILSNYPNVFDNVVTGSTNSLHVKPDKWCSPLHEINGSYLVSGNEHLNLQVSTDQTSKVVASQASSGSESLSNPIQSFVSENAAPVSGSFGEANKGISDLKSNLEHIISNFQESLDTVYNSFSLSVNNNFRNVAQSVDNSVSGLFNSADTAKQQAGGKFALFTTDFKGNMYGAGTAAVDILRQAIISLEDLLASASTFAVYSYGSTKVLLPEEARNVLNISEEKAAEILKPVTSTFQQVQFVVETFERSLGLDPNDPIVPFITFLCASTIIGVCYWVLQYGGYSGDLSPEQTLNLLKNKEDAVLIDVRPEDLREREGIPDLRRGARPRYMSVTFPKVDNSAKKLLKNVSKIDDALLAVVICNLKIVQTGSKVIIMDTYGERSKGIARTLRKFGVKRPYLIQGGFRSWVKNGLRIKQLKTETALTLLNEEAEAILDDIRPTPALVIGYGLASCVALYSLLEWEKTLQLIGIVGLGQTLYKRIASYEDSEGFQQDLRLLLAPVTLGLQAFSWAVGKLETEKARLPTTPSSTAVQDRVLQAVAKHESQAFDSEGVQSSEPSTQSGDNLDLSEA